MTAPVKTAHYLHSVPGYGTVALYALDTPYNADPEPVSYVLVSAITDPRTEVIVLPASVTGEVLSYRELAGIKGSRSHRAALEALGYQMEG